MRLISVKVHLFWKTVGQWRVLKYPIKLCCTPCYCTILLYYLLTSVLFAQNANITHRANIFRRRRRLDKVPCEPGLMLSWFHSDVLWAVLQKFRAADCIFIGHQTIILFTTWPYVFCSLAEGTSSFISCSAFVYVCETLRLYSRTVRYSLFVSNRFECT